MHFNEWLNVYRFESRRKGPLRGLIRSLRPHLQRRYSRKLLAHYITPSMKGLELGAGEQSIAPLSQTLLADAYETHAGAKSLATAIFPAEKIPYPDSTFDFILNEHVLEHIPNALGAIREWKRVLKPKGVLFLFLPHPERTFDRYREITSLGHFQNDLENNANSLEDAHWTEWENQVLKKGLASHYANYSKEETLKNNLLHRHVFTPASIRELLTSEGWEIMESIDAVQDRFDTFAVFARK